jgi:pimeloyl-ACP methyl ester carboxylesterase
MSDPGVLITPQGRRIAYRRQEGEGPGVVFLGGYRSDMTGTKAEYLAEWCADRGRAFLRFDYSGHGRSSEPFEEGCIGDWAEDAAETIGALTKDPQILVGSSMGGWISLLMARRIGRVAGLVTVAAAPDFTEDGMWASMSPEEREMLESDGRVIRPGEWEDHYVVTRKLIEDGRRHLVLRSPLPLEFPVRFLQGSEDTAVDPSVALRLFAHSAGPDIRLTLVKGADHRFSTPDCLTLLGETLAEMLARA